MDEIDFPVLMETDLPLPIFIRGKVRDTYDLGSHLLIVATDRVSAFDVVLPNGIPLKGHVLSRLSSFWFRRIAEIMPHHMTEALDNVHSLDSYLPEEKRFTYPSYLRGRSMVVKKAKRLPIECVVRGYLSGSAWTEYKKKGTVSGMPMPAGLRESDKLEKPIFTPTTKAEIGHDEPLSKEKVIKIFGLPISQELEAKSLAIYESARDYALSKGIIIADTKFEFGIDNGRLILIDEALTPDSSRFWDAEKYKAGQPQDSMDKQPVRDWLTASGWNKQPPAPPLPPEVVKATSKGYIMAYERITGRKLAILE
ncbi:MAG: phosphoribosylaminoimidazolesuccinocarboxamide synthase [Chloroflexi bacterium RBG_13_51_18]|nr:MAG: phosphoribosylaminoimidazolesuccinocarboxamide synthase [Chloroflexi bacterium RBG_13_51_18]